MKNKIIVSAIALIGFATNSNGQATATASTTAVLVTPISIAKNFDMHFGTVAASGTVGTIVLDYANGTTATGGASIPVGGITPSTAQFTVTGQGTSGFSISHPTSLTLTETVGGVATMTVNSITNDLGASSALVGGTKVIKLKGILNLGVGQIAGTYTNANTLAVTVNYN